MIEDSRLARAVEEARQLRDDFVREGRGYHETWDPEWYRFYYELDRSERGLPPQDRKSVV